MNPSFDEQVAALEKDWAENSRWNGVTRDYTAADVVRLRGSVTRSTPSPARARRSSGTASTTWTTSTPSAP